MMAYLNIEDRRAYQRRYREKHRAKLNGYARAYARRQKVKFPSHKKNYKRAYDLKRKYGLTEADVAAILDIQGDGCAICRNKHPGRSGWQVDHNHKSKKVRGVLCSPCNLMLGLARDDKLILQQAVRYLNRGN